MVATDTIYAPATPAGGAIAIIRVSGPEAIRAGQILSGVDISRHPRLMRRVALRDASGAVFDDAMLVCFQKPKSYTGEDMLELYCHGGPQVLRMAFSSLRALGLRPAEAGEFTRRAFLNGKMDLTQAEAVMDLINAQAAAGARAALHQMQGRLRDRIEALENQLLDAQSAVAAAIDYPEEMEADVLCSLPETLLGILSALGDLIQEGQAGRLLREGIGVALAGRPNVGKSSLLNALLGRDRAIVTDQPGTTRDTLEEQAVFDGVLIRLTDTAGLRQAADEAEKIGVERARQAVAQSDIALILLDGSTPLLEEDRALLQETETAARLILRTKCDLPAAWETPPGIECMHVSAKTGEGLPALKAAILALAGAQGLEQGETTLTNERHIRCLVAAEACLRAALCALQDVGLDCASTDMQEALHHLGAITGRDVDEAIIDRVFENFCVGK